MINNFKSRVSKFIREVSMMKEVAKKSVQMSKEPLVDYDLNNIALQSLKGHRSMSLGLQRIMSGKPVSDAERLKIATYKNQFCDTNPVVLDKVQFWMKKSPSKINQPEILWREKEKSNADTQKSTTEQSAIEKLKKTTRLNRQRRKLDESNAKPDEHRDTFFKTSA